MKKIETHNDIHIGSIIKAITMDRKITKTVLGQMINCHISTIHDIYNRKSITTDLLWQISIALEFDFFTHIYGDRLDDILCSDEDSAITTIVLTQDKVTIEQKKGISKISEYAKVSEK